MRLHTAAFSLFLLKRHTIGTLIYGRICFMGTNNDAIQRAIFTTGTVVGTLGHMAFDAAVFFGRTLHSGRLLSRNRESDRKTISLRLYCPPIFLKYPKVTRMYIPFPSILSKVHLKFHSLCGTYCATKRWHHYAPAATIWKMLHL